MGSSRNSIDSLIRLAQRCLLDFAPRVARQRIDDDDPLRHLEFCEPFAERGEHAWLGDECPGPQNDDRSDTLSQIGMRRSEDCAFKHAVHCVDLSLNLFRINVESSGYHEVLGATDEVNIAVRVDPTQIPGNEESVRSELLHCLFRHPPIPTKDVWALDFDDADLPFRDNFAAVQIADTHIDAWEREANRPHSALAVVWVGCDHGGFCHPVSFEDRMASPLAPCHVR